MLGQAPPNRPKVKASEVSVYTDTTDFECSWEKVALIRAQGSMSSISDKKMLKRSKEQAAEVRANAIIVGRLGTNDPDMTWGGGTDYGSREGRFLAAYEERPCSR